MLLRSLPLSFLFVAQLCSAGELYRIVGPDGKVSYTDRPPSTEGLTAVKGSNASPLAGTTQSAQAALKVLVMQKVVDSLTNFCSRQIPESGESVRTARAAWSERNFNLTGKSSKVVRDLLNTEQLVQLNRQMEAENSGLERRASTATVEMKKTWCAEAPRNFNAHQMDPSRDQALVRAVHDYKLK